jgi:hypothetical protein
VGTITLTVYRERKGRARPADITDRGAELAAVAKGSLPGHGEATAKNYNALKAQLLHEANRGVIVEGAPVNNPVQTVKFDPDPIPVMSVTVVYYRP